ncbi:MAG: DNA pilot protein [Microvirus sp.]|nr:MAG: DNA pilot protein [Microvirus sp.]
MGFFSQGGLFSNILGAVPVVGGIAEGVYNGIQQGRANRQNQQNMMTQRQWALDDWNRQNDYNSPAKQMQRYKDAGLNPNLIYGQSNTTAPVRTSDTAKIQPVQSNVANSMVSGMLAMYDLNKTIAQTNLLKQQEETEKARQRNIGQMTMNAGQRYRLGEGMMDYSLTIAQRKANNLLKEGNLLDSRDTNVQTNTKLTGAKYGQTLMNTSFTEHQIRNNAVLTNASLANTAQKILESRANVEKTNIGRALIGQQITNLKQDYRVKQMEERLNKVGLTKGDNTFYRLYNEFLDELITPQ